MLKNVGYLIYVAFAQIFTFGNPSIFSVGPFFIVNGHNFGLLNTFGFVHNFGFNTIFVHAELQTKSR